MSLTLSPIRFEHSSNALGIGQPRPRLSWVVTDAPADWSQSAYEVQQRDGASVRVDSPDSVLVPWPFEPLASRERREIRVRVVDADGSASDWSAWACVEAGLLERSDWSAQMVGPADSAVASPLVRGAFRTRSDSEVVRARVYATAHGLFQLELNGHRVGDDELAPGWTAYESRLRYTTYDVTGLVRSGENAIGAWLADGWWRGYLGWGGKRGLYGDDLGVMVQLEVHYADGARQTVASGTDWVAGRGPIHAADLYNGEDYDARDFDPAWSTVDAATDGWTPVALRPLGEVELSAPDGPPVRVVERIPVQRVLTSPSGATILDFGQNLVGRLRLTVEGEAGTRVTLRHAEVLEGGELAVAPLRGAKATDSYTLVGVGTESWAPRFTFHGFRYAEVTGWPGPIDPEAVTAEVLHSDMQRTGWFETDHPLVNRLHENVVWGMRGNFVDVPTDCPQRDERLGWTGDLQVFAPTATYLYDSAGFLVSWLKDLAAEQRKYGGTTMVVPAIVTGYTGPTAGWADAATVVPWTLYQAYGDIGVLETQFESMAAWVDEVTAAAGPDRIWSAGFQFGDWLDPTAPADRPEQAQTYPEIVATAYFARSARIVADAAALLGRSADAERYGALASEVKAAFHREYVSRSGRLLSDSATAYSLALTFDLIDDADERRHAADRLAEIVAGNGYRIPTGFIGTPILTDALSANGHADTAYRLLLQTEAPSWLYTVEQGATTIWERWDSLLPDGSVNPSGMTSFNHYAFGAVADWMHRVVAGLAAAAPGYRRLRIAPQPPRRGLSSASATLHTPYGIASAGWELRDGGILVSTTIPVGVKAEVVLPSGRAFEVAAGEHHWQEPFEVDAEVARVYTVDSRMGDIVDHKPALDVLKGVIGKWVPGAADHMSGGLRGQEDLTPRQITGMLPDPAGVLADLERGFAALNAGEPIPADVFTAPAPIAADSDLQEKAMLLSGRDFWSTQEAAGVPSMIMVDGPHGVRRQDRAVDSLGFNESLPATCFPPGVAMGSTWDPELMCEVGVALGEEARALNVNMILGPAINIKRSPLGGRTFEYLSEDPLLTGVLATEYVRGVQSTGVGTSVKHFAANNQETGRMRVSVEADQRTLREIYLPAFERVVTEARPTSVMSAYNAINGVFASENRWLLTELLRDEWGFDGLVVSDWGAIKDRVEALRAGLDLEMPGTGDEGTEAILRAVRDGRLDRAVVEQAAARVAALVDRTRLPDEPSAFDAEAHHALARRAAAAGVVLLRNEDQTLPLREGQKVAVIGTLAVEPQFQGGGSSHVTPTRLDIPLDELRVALGETSVSFAPGYADDGDPAQLRAEAAEAAAAADVAVVFVGLSEKEQSEGFDRSTIDLPQEHVALIHAVAGRARRTVVVLSNGGVVSLEPWHDFVDAIVEGWALGQAVGGALADVLTGAVNPSGRLAESIPLRLQDTPSYLNFPGENEVVRYGEGVFVGYRYYATADRPVRYPFGHGLSYTTFAHDVVELAVTGPDAAVVRVAVRNTGQAAGAEVVQVYVAPAPAPVRRPVRELAAFRKVHLEPGETRTVEMALDRRAFAYWDTQRERWQVEPGEYRVEIGRSSADITTAATVTLDGDVDRPAPLSLESTVGDWFGHPVVGPALMQAMVSEATAEQRAAAEDSADMLRMVESMPMAQFARFPGVEISDDALDQLIALSRSGS
ncbi:family 78 glycoside hydrolase catalytic domain [Microbacterium sp. JZ37]|uniref:family 78 glycoside hydrolase catalytic domain n=1 Tax=Microbacterium sp. JZ37 TaxID=2654193 RepID=UPI002B4865BC|nr:family 78 glycoside hydrolase catalytic domain [Microbacterium sp. JZ37]